MPFPYRSRNRFFVVALLFAAAFPVAGTATTIRVPADKPTIQAAIDGAANGDTVLVSDGTYTENIDFKGKAITVKSVNGPANAIVDGGGLDIVVKFVTQETSSSVLAGFTIRNGRPSVSTTYNGGGIAISSSSPTIQNNIITANFGCAGVGIGVSFGSPLIQGNTITNNQQSGCTGGTGGGGILIGGASQPQIIGNTISNNSTGSDGGGISLFAAGTPIIRGNTIIGNTSGGQGGGISMGNQSDAIVTDNVIKGNTALKGGGVATLVPSGANGPTLVNNTFFANSGPQGGSELYFSGFANQTQFLNDIFVGSAGQIAVDCDTTYSTQSPIFRFNDVFNPSGTTFAGSCSSSSGNNGNISADPLFVNSAASDFHLQATSPAIDAGSNTAPSLPTQDIAGNPRILDGNGDCVAIVDMGAYEFAPPSVLTVVPVNLAFADQIVGSTSAALSTTITNTASTATTVCGISITGDFSQTNTCASSIAAKGSCTVNVDFTPTAQGVRSSLLQITTTDGGSPRSVSLTGNGTDFSIAAASNGSTSATVTAGNTATYNLQISPLSGFTGTVALTCTGAPSLAVCTASSATVTPSGSPSPFAISVTTTAAASLAVPRMTPPRMPPFGFFLLVLLLFSVFALMISLAGLASPLPHRRGAFACSLVILLVALIWAGGCGSSGSSGPKNPGTPKGPYSLTVTASSNGVSHPLVLSLTVN
jgi:parallel beta-helix repeat protein